MKKIVFIAIAMLISGATFAATIEVNVRNRPPDLNVDNGKYSGPLKDILEKAAERAGHSVNWVEAPFKRAYEDAKSGRIDLVPRTFYRESRKTEVHYLDPVGYQEKDIVFFVKKGKENVVKSYDDLKNVSIGVKRGSAFYEKFDGDTSLNKVEGTEDEALVKMFIGDRFDVMVSIDPLGMKQEFEKLGFSDYSFTEYKHVKRTGVYYASSKKRYDTDRKSVYDSINDQIQKMVSSGEVSKIYESHGATPPVQ